MNGGWYSWKPWRWEPAVQSEILRGDVGGERRAGPGGGLEGCARALPGSGRSGSTNSRAGRPSNRARTSTSLVLRAERAPKPASIGLARSASYEEDERIKPAESSLRMTPLRHTAAVAALCICLLLLPAGPAWGATTVGQLFAPIDGCASNSIYLQTGVASGTGYTIPSDGVVTSWSYQLGNAAITGLRLEIADPGSAGSHTIVGQAAAGSQTPGAVNSYPARIPVKAGDIIGIFFGGGGNCLLGTGMGGDAIDYHAGDLSPGASAMFTQLTGNRLPVKATVEADADHDGFGDETQDQCPAAPGPVNGCPSNAFSFGKVKRNTRKGTATLTVIVPGPGTLVLTGGGPGQAAFPASRPDRSGCGFQGSQRRRQGETAGQVQGQEEAPAKPYRQGEGGRKGHLHPDGRCREHQDEADQARQAALERDSRGDVAGERRDRPTGLQRWRHQLQSAR